MCFPFLCVSFFGGVLSSMADLNQVPLTSHTSSGHRFQHSYIEPESTLLSVGLPFTHILTIHIDPKFQLTTQGRMHLAQDRLVLPNVATSLPIHQFFAAVQSFLCTHGFSRVD